MRPAERAEAFYLFIISLLFLELKLLPLQFQLFLLQVQLLPLELLPVKLLLIAGGGFRDRDGLCRNLLIIQVRRPLLRLYLFGFPRGRGVGLIVPKIVAQSQVYPQAGIIVFEQALIRR